MGEPFFQDGDFNVWFCHGDREIPWHYQTHKMVDGKLIKARWTEMTLREALENHQRRTFSGSLQSDSWYWKIELKEGRDNPGLMG